MSRDQRETIQSVTPVERTAPQKRDLKKVPFVELFGGRLQGVVSPSSGDPKRVYCNFFEAGSGDYYCSTNNNRACVGLRGGVCKHLKSLLGNAVSQYGSERVIRYLRLDTEDYGLDAQGIQGLMRGSQKTAPANEVFSRFMNYLRYVELSGDLGPAPEMDFFITG